MRAHGYSRISDDKEGRELGVKRQEADIRALAAKLGWDLVQLTGTDGNVFSLAGRVTTALRRAGHTDAADSLMEELQQCGSYDEALALFMRKVYVS